MEFILVKKKLEGMRTSGCALALLRFPVLLHDNFCCAVDM